MSDADWNAKFEKLLKETAELRAELDALKLKAEPKPFKVEAMPRIDWTEGMSMSRATMAEFAAAASGGGIANDAWRSTQPSSIIPKTGPEPKVERGTGWQPERPIEGPPGVKIIDEMMATEDAMWRRDRALQFGHGLKKEDKP